MSDSTSARAPRERSGRAGGEELQRSGSDGLGGLPRQAIALLVLLEAVTHPMTALKDLLTLAGGPVRRLAAKAARPLKPVVTVTLRIRPRRNRPTFEDYLHRDRESPV